MLDLLAPSDKAGQICGEIVWARLARGRQQPLAFTVSGESSQVGQQVRCALITAVRVLR